MHECTQASYIEKLPKGKHSTKGIGKTQPDPKASKVLEDVEVPLGKGCTDHGVNSALLYNEYPFIERFYTFLFRTTVFVERLILFRAFSLTFFQIYCI